MQHLPFADKWTGDKGQQQEEEMKSLESRTWDAFNDDGTLDLKKTKDFIINEVDTEDQFLKDARAMLERTFQNSVDIDPVKWRADADYRKENEAQPYQMYR